MLGWIVLLMDAGLLAAKAASAAANTLYQCAFPLPLKSVDGDIVLVTGAAHGIGRELALQFSCLGATVVCWDVKDSENAATAREITSKGYKAHAYTCDVSDRQQVVDATKAVEKDVGAISIVVNNAAILQYHALAEHPPEDIRKHFEVNVFSYFWVLQAVLPGMLKRGRGHLVGLCSMCGLAGSPNMSAYSSTKFAVRGLMESVREELRLHPRGANIHCTCVYPFFVDTGMARDPNYRFPSLFSAMPVEEAARQVVWAVRANYPELSLPWTLLWADRVSRLLPRSVFNLMMDLVRDGKMKTAEEF